MIVGARVVFTDSFGGNSHDGQQGTVLEVRAQSATVRFDDGVADWVRKDELEVVQ